LSIRKSATSAPPTLPKLVNDHAPEIFFGFHQLYYLYGAEHFLVLISSLHFQLQLPFFDSIHIC
jgi:hypothetical protein